MTLRNLIGRLARVGAWLAVSLAAGPALAHGGGGGGGGHGGGGHVVVTGGYYSGGFYIIPGTQMPLELLDTAPTAMEGQLTPGAVVAQHTVRVADARVLTEDFTEKQGLLVNLTWPMTAGTVLTRVVLHSNPKHEIWCQLPKPLKPQGESTFECLADEGHTGAFTRLWFGRSSNRFLGVTFSTATEGKLLAKPLHYRAATVVERPTARIGYQWCDGDGVKTPPRFALVTRFDDDESWTGGGPAWCAAGTWPDLADHAHVDVFGLKLTLTPTAGQGFSYKVDGRMPAVPLLAIFRQGFPPRGDGAPVTTVEAQLMTPLMLGQHPFARAGAAPTHAEGKIVDGTVLATFALQRHPTGILLNRIVLDPKDPSGDALEIGQPMFGYTQKTAVGRLEMVWCAPRLQPDKHWLTWCINGQAQAIRAREAFFPSPRDTIGFGVGFRQVASVASVKLQQVDFPILNVTMTYSGAYDRDASAVYLADWGEGPKKVETDKIVFDATGAARVQIADGVLLFHRTAKSDGVGAQTTADFQPTVQIPPAPPKGPVTPVTVPPAALSEPPPAAATGPQL